MPSSPCLRHAADKKSCGIFRLPDCGRRAGFSVSHRAARREACFGRLKRISPSVGAMTNAGAPDAGNICAVIVTYNADLGRLTQILGALADSVACIVIVDNGSADFVGDALRSRFPNLLVKRLAENN